MNTKLYIIIPVIFFIIYLLISRNSNHETDEYMDIIEKKNLLYFYSPQCKYCEMFDPTWNMLIKKYQKSNVILKKFDATKLENTNLTKKYQIQGYPTILLETKKIKEYEGNRKYDDIVEFIDSTD